MLVQDLSNGFCSETLRAVEDRARERGVVVMAASTDEDGDRERELVRGLVSRRIDGLILMPTGPDLSWLGVELASGLAVVTVDRRPAIPELDGVVVDNQGAAAEAVGHLMAYGHRRIAFLGDTTSISTAVDRRDGYRAALRAAGLTPDPLLERVGLRSRDDAFAATTQLLAMEEPPTAIFAARNVICEGALMALQQLHLSSQVALIGFDEVSVAEMVDPAISVIRQDTYEIGTRAIDLLLARLDGDDSQRPRRSGAQHPRGQGLRRDRRDTRHCSCRDRRRPLVGRALPTRRRIEQSPGASPSALLRRPIGGRHSCWPLPGQPASSTRSRRLRVWTEGRVLRNPRRATSVRLPAPAHGLGHAGGADHWLPEDRSETRPENRAEVRPRLASRTSLTRSTAESASRG